MFNHDMSCVVPRGYFFWSSSYEKNLNMKKAMNGDKKHFIVMMICTSQFGSCGKRGYGQR
jgi:hypothetical protein